LLVFFICTGGDDLKGKRVASVRGTDIFRLSSPVNISSIAGTSLETVLAGVTNIGVLSIPVFTDFATINFQSRSTAGLHFFAIYETSKQCPTGYIFNTEIKQCQYVDVKKYIYQQTNCLYILSNIKIE
jgi:hypothetical protein